MLSPALAPMVAYRQFILCKLAPTTTPGKLTKLPCDWRTGAISNAHDEAIHTDWVSATLAAQSRGDGWGVGFVFTANDPFWFLDIDNCRSGGAWSTVATEVCAALPGAAVEVSQSGRGLHLFGSGVAPIHGCKNVPLGLEFYTEGRFVFLGDQSTAVGSAGMDATALLPGVVGRWFPPRAEGVVGETGLDWTDGPCEGWRGPTGDADLLRRAMASKSARAAFSGGASFADLWRADEAALGRAFPDAGGRAYDASSADAALAQHLAFWTGRDCARIERLMRQSALVRDKWDSRADYLTTRTIIGACLRSRDVLQDKALEAVALPAAETAAGATRVSGATFLGLDEQIEHF